ncbi:MAG: hypothetical protein IID44_28675 [Planctomycetes bacterium]|nr:hypothetical protein [Planctomycetota bacterium]
MNELRAILADEIKKIRDGETTAANVNAVSNATGKILSTVKIEMEYAKLLGRAPHIPLLMAETETAPRELIFATSAPIGI